ncbi:group-specific protein [Bacillus cereus]|uniref:group-specific protein n=1 Tax=Bacillus cereus TaxID=1396 RepID=UPI00356D3CDC
MLKRKNEGASMKYYISSSFGNMHTVRSVASSLHEKGFVQTYDWTKNQRANTLNDLMEIGEQEKQAILDSDFLIVLSPAGKGSHIEFGIALGVGKPIYLYSEHTNILDFATTSTFYHVKGVQTFVGELSSFIDFVLSERSMIHR